MAVLSIGKALGIVESVTYLYALADGYVVGLDDNKEFAFSSGSWLPHAIFGFGHDAETTFRSHLIVACGYEGNKTRRLVRELEPDRISLLIANDSVPDHRHRAREANRALALDYMLGDESISFVDHLDTRGTVASTQAIAQPQLGSTDAQPPEFANFLLSGPKTLALALAIVSLDTPMGALYYARPDVRNESSVEGISSFLRVTVEI